MKYAIHLTVATIICTFCASTANSQQQDFTPLVPTGDPLKVENPNTLRVLYEQSDGCPVTMKSIETTIDGLLVRSRLKRYVFGPYNSPITLVVSARCSGTEDGRPYIYKVSAAFAEIVRVQRSSEKLVAAVFHNPFHYGVYGTTSNQNDYEQTVSRAVRETVEKALTDYLKANFDL